MIFAGAFFLILFFLFVEKLLHDRRLKKIQIRIHVNGTRGKTTVTRLIASRLRLAGIRTVAKITGDRALFIDPDGREEAIARRAPSRIQEQVRFVKRAARLGAQAIVVECMALEPSLQYVSESRMIRSTLGVITNVRPDHFEKMGNNLDEIAASLSRTVPQQGVLVTADRPYFEYFRERALEKGTQIRLAVSAAGDTNLFPENLAVVETVCACLGMPSVGPRMDGPERPLVWSIEHGEKHVYLVDAFSANDVESTCGIERAALKNGSFPLPPFVALLNNRIDRPLRMRSFTSYLSNARLYDFVALTGDNVWLAGRSLRERGRAKGVFALESRTPEEVIEEIVRRVGKARFTVVGMGNHKGIGEGLRHLFETWGRPCS